MCSGRTVFALILFLFVLVFPPLSRAEIFDVADGTYEVAEGLITLKVSVESQRITGIKVLENRGQEDYLEKVQPLIDRIVDEQTLEVDTVTGATMTSTDLINALKKVLTAK